MALDLRKSLAYGHPVRGGVSPVAPALQSNVRMHFHLGFGPGLSTRAVDSGLGAFEDTDDLGIIANAVGLDQDFSLNTAADTAIVGAGTPPVCRNAAADGGHYGDFDHFSTEGTGGLWALAKPDVSEVASGHFDMVFTLGDSASASRWKGIGVLETGGSVYWGFYNGGSTWRFGPAISADAWYAINFFNNGTNYTMDIIAAGAEEWTLAASATAVAVGTPVEGEWFDDESWGAELDRAAIFNRHRTSWAVAFFGDGVDWGWCDGAFDNADGHREFLRQSLVNVVG